MYRVSVRADHVDSRNDDVGGGSFVFLFENSPRAEQLSRRARQENQPWQRILIISSPELNPSPGEESRGDRGPRLGQDHIDDVRSIASICRNDLLAPATGPRNSNWR